MKIVGTQTPQNGIYLDGVWIRDVIDIKVVGGVATVRRYVRNEDGHLVHDPKTVGEALIETLTGTELVVKHGPEPK